VLASEAGGEIEASTAWYLLGLSVSRTFERCDLTVYPAVHGDPERAESSYLSQVRRLAAGARYITSVCNGH